MTNETTTATIACPVDGCGEQVAVTSAGFAATTVTLAACANRRAEGVTSYEVPKSIAMGW
jgi:hypothetical protein